MVLYNQSPQFSRSNGNKRGFMMPPPESSGILLYDGGLVYVVFRDSRPLVNPNMLAPITGRIERGESPVKGITREVNEETGLVIDTDQIFLMGTRIIRHPLFGIQCNHMFRYDWRLRGDYQLGEGKEESGFYRPDQIRSLLRNIAPEYRQIMDEMTDGLGRRYFFI